MNIFLKYSVGYKRFVTHRNHIFLATISSPPSANKRSLAKQSLFKKDFSPRMKTDEPQMSPARDSSKVPSSSNETWRSDTLVRIIVSFFFQNSDNKFKIILISFSLM